MDMEVDVESTRLSQIYHDAITKAFDTTFTLPGSTINDIHRIILKELSKKSRQLLASGCIIEGFSRRLEYEVAPILEAAKKANAKKKFALNAVKRKGLYERINYEIYHHQILEGEDNSDVKYKMRQWLKDFGTEHNKFSSVVYGTWTKVSDLLYKVDEKLNVENLVPEILKRSKQTQYVGEVHLDSAAYLKVDPILMKCFVHDPSEVIIDEDTDLDTYTVSYQNVVLNFPVCRPSKVMVTIEADVEYYVTKALVVNTWAVVLSLGINALFNKEAKETFSHHFKLKVQIPTNAIKLREKIEIKVSEERATHFLGIYKQFEEFTKALSGGEQQPRITDDQFALDPQVAILYERFPWLMYIETMRRGGIRAANELLKKKPDILRNLPADTNNALGVAFEEIQIAKVMAEAHRRGVNLEHVAGDGHGRLRLERGEIQTPEYIDAVFRNRETGELFAVQFKYSDTIENLLDMMQRWRVRHTDADVNLPETFQVDNVQMIGPRDVIQNVESGDFSHEMDIGAFRVSADDRDSMRKFLEDNTDLLQEIVNSRDWNKRGELRQERTKWKNKLESSEGRLQRLRDKLTSLKESRTIDNERAISEIESKIQVMENANTNIKQKYEKADLEIKQIEEKTATLIEERLNASYAKKNITKQMLKEAALNIVIQAATDGIITLVITSDEELRKYFRGEITLWECVKQITKGTAIATARGGAIGLGFSGITMLAHYAGLQGWRCAGALSLGSKLVGPALIAGLFMYESYNIVQHWKNKEITTAEMEKAIARTVTANALSIGGSIAAGCLIGGPAGLLVGAGIAIAVGVGDYYLGDKVWSVIIKENPEEAKAIILQKYKHLRSDVLKAAYDLFNLTEHATEEEVKEAFKAAVLKYHPDKGGNAELFHAIYAAYEVIRNSRNENL